MAGYAVYKDKNIIITGGAGAIGSNLVRRLLEESPAGITVLDDLSSSYAWNLPTNPAVRLVSRSILDDEALASAFSDGIHYVFHLAAHFANQNSMENPNTNLMVNGMGTLKLLQYAQMAKTLERFVFASAGCSIYGSDPPLPVHEGLPVSIHMETPYQITKFLGELYCNFYHGHYGLPVVRSRIHNSYGPGEVPGQYRNVIPNFVWRAMHGKPLTITGDGTETRDFIFVADLVDGLMKCGADPKAIGEAFNLSSNNETRVIDLAETINRLVGNKAGITYTQRRDWDKISARRSSYDKANKTLGFKPQIDMEQGLKSTIAWFKKHEAEIAAVVEGR